MAEFYSLLFLTWFYDMIIYWLIGYKGTATHHGLIYSANNDVFARRHLAYGKQLAAIAVKYLYHMQDAVESSMKDAVESSIEDAIESGPLLEAGLRAVYRGLKRECNCALKWRTILLSSQGKTLYPYSQYIHVLNLQDLERLLTRSEIGDIANIVLFQGELEEFAVRHLKLDTVKTASKIGKAITKQIPQLKVLTGQRLPGLMKFILSAKSIRLTSLEYEYEYSISLPTQTIIDKNFNQALANQTSLQKLSLKMAAFDNERRLLVAALDGTNLVECLSKLVNLTDLHLDSIAYVFDDQQIVQLASCLPKLEVCSISGLGLTDAIWDGFGSLKSLRRLQLDALSSFTSGGILGFIERLGPGNNGLVLSLTNANALSDLSWAVWMEKDLIQKTIAKKIKGRFEFEFDQDDY